MKTNPADPYACDCKCPEPPADGDDSYYVYGAVWNCPVCHKTWLLSIWLVPGQDSIKIWVEPEINTIRTN